MTSYILFVNVVMQNFVEMKAAINGSDKNGEN